MWVKWIFDRVMALLGIIVLMPLFLFVAILIAFKMPDGPVVYKQKRVGQNGKLFTMVKFRTMKVDQKGGLISVAGESRITPLGSVLRKYKIDELLQLWNVLKGDMSFVGPRPDVPEYVNKLVGEEREILSLKPGITGPASLKYNNEEYILSKVDDPMKYYDEVIFPDKVRINQEYLHNWSFWGDIRIILRTILR